MTSPKLSPPNSIPTSPRATRTFRSIQPQTQLSTHPKPAGKRSSGSSPLKSPTRARPNRHPIAKRKVPKRMARK